MNKLRKKGISKQSKDDEKEYNVYVYMTEF